MPPASYNARTIQRAASVLATPRPEPPLTPTRSIPTFTKGSTSRVAVSGFGSIAQAQLNAPASTVECFEVQNILTSSCRRTGRLSSLRLATAATTTVALRASSTSYSSSARMPPETLAVFLPVQATWPSAGLISSGLGIHSEGSNYLCADGHVKWLRPGRPCPAEICLLLLPPRAAGFRRRRQFLRRRDWQPDNHDSTAAIHSRSFSPSARRRQALRNGAEL